MGAVYTLAASLLIQFPVNAQGKAEGGPSAGDSITHVQDPQKAPGFGLAQQRLLWPHGE